MGMGPGAGVHFSVTTDSVFLQIGRTGTSGDRRGRRRGSVGRHSPVSMATVTSSRYRRPDHSSSPPPDSPTWFGRLYRDGKVRRIVSAEHTALVEREDRERLQRVFAQPHHGASAMGTQSGVGHAHSGARHRHR